MNTNWLLNSSNAEQGTENLHFLLTIIKPFIFQGKVQSHVPILCFFHGIYYLLMYDIPYLWIMFTGFYQPSPL